MHLDETSLLLISRAFRRAIENADLSEASVGREAYLRMYNFPDSACAEATTLLGICLTRDYDLSTLVKALAQIEEGDKWVGTHEWLEHNGIIIDITADQFSIVNEPVIVTRQSHFHSQYAREIYKYPVQFRLEDQPDWIVRLYNITTGSLRNNYVTSGSS